jgi:hypothetical protein
MPIVGCKRPGRFYDNTNKGEQLPHLVNGGQPLKILQFYVTAWGRAIEPRPFRWGVGKAFLLAGLGRSKRPAGCGATGSVAVAAQQGSEVFRPL